MRAHEALLDLLSAPDGAPALIEPASGERTTYGELRATADRLARSLAEAGVGPGDAVAMSLPNGPEIVAAFLAAVAAGAASAPLNQAYTAEEFHAYLDDLRPRAMLFLRGEASPARSACEALGIRRLELVGHAHGRARARRRARDRLATGARSRGRRAAAAHERHDEQAQGRAASGSATWPPPRARSPPPTRSRPRRASHCAMPLFHVHGLVASTLATLASGGTVIAPRRFSASAFWPDCATLRGDLVLGRADDPPHPALPRRGRRAGSRRPPPALRPLLLLGAARPAHGGASRTRFGLPLVEAYGMTEAAHQMASNPLPPGERRAGSVGLPTGTEIAILDDELAAAGGGAVGEVCVRGPGVVDGYRANPEATAASFRDGWFRTGDSGRLSPTATSRWPAASRS